jgi:hypothetical protein
MSSPRQTSLPKLAVGDFGPGLDHVAESCQNERIVAIVHKDDPVRQFLPTIYLDPNDAYTYVFVHGGQEESRFENMQTGTHEIPAHVVAQLLTNQFGSRLDGMTLRMCTCYGNLLRPGDTHTAVQSLAALLPRTSFEGYHGLVHVDPTVPPARIVLSDQLAWDSQTGPYYLDPPVRGQWEPVRP